MNSMRLQDGKLIKCSLVKFVMFLKHFIKIVLKTFPSTKCIHLPLYSEPKIDKHSLRINDPTDAA